MLIEVDLLRSHRLGLDDGLDPLLLGQLEDVVLHRLAIVSSEDLGTGGFGALSKLRNQFLQMAGGVILAVGDLLAQGFEVDPLVGLGSADPVGLREPVQRSAQNRVFQGSGDGRSELIIHRSAPSRSSTKTTTNRSGPCIPMVSTRSMSAGRLGP